MTVAHLAMKLFEILFRIMALWTRLISVYCSIDLYAEVLKILSTVLLSVLLLGTDIWTINSNLKMLITDVFVYECFRGILKR